MSHCIIIFTLIIATVSTSIKNNLILDYFCYKKVASVVGFSCNAFEDDLLLIKRLNKISITAAIRKLDDSQIQQFAYSYHKKIGIFLDSDCYNTKSAANLLSEAGKYGMYDELHSWLVIGPNLTEALNIIDDDTFGMTTDFVIAVPFTVEMAEEERCEYELHDVYNIWKERGGTLDITFLGLWREKGISNITLATSSGKFKKRANLQGITMKTVFYYTPYKPEKMPLEEYLKDDYTSSKKDGLWKFGYIVMTHLSEMFNFKIECLSAGKWKLGDPTGPLMRGIIRRKFDVSGSPAIMTIERTYIIKYFHYTWPFRTCFIFKSPQKDNISIREILGPLKIDVWYLCLILLTLSVVSLTIALRYENNNDVESIQLPNALLMTLGALCQVGTEMKLNHASTRIAFLFVMIFSYLIYNYYSASVVSIRLNEPIYKINDSLVQLGKTDLRLASERMSYLQLFIQRKYWETKTFYTNKWKNIKEEDMFMDPEKAVEYMRYKRFAYHCHPEVIYPFINRQFTNREVCELNEVHLVKPTYAAFAVQINSTLVEMLRVGMSRLVEVGIRDRQVFHWKPRKPECILSASSIKMNEFAPHLILLVFGMGLAAAIFILEIIIQKYNTGVRIMDNLY